MTLTELRCAALDLEQAGDSAVRYLFDVLIADPVPERRQLAAGILAKIGTDEIISRTWELLEGECLDDRRKLDVLGVLLQADDYDLDLERSARCFTNAGSIAENVINMLSAVNGDEENVFLWQSALLEMPAELQHVVVNTLLDTRSASVIPHLRGAIELELHPVALQIARGLREISVPESVGLLGELQAYPQIDVRRVARESLRYLHSKGVSLQDVFVRGHRPCSKLHRAIKHEYHGMLTIIVSKWMDGQRIKYGVFLVDETRRGLHTCFGELGLSESEFEEFLETAAGRISPSEVPFEEIDLKEARQAVHYGYCVAQENGYSVPPSYLLFRDLIDRVQASAAPGI